MKVVDFNSYIKEDSTVVEPKASESPVVVMLEKRYAEEILQWYHYYIISNFLVGKERPNIEKTFVEFADDELNDHAVKLLKRINELGGDVEKLKILSNLASLSDCTYTTPTLPYDTKSLVLMNIEHEKCAIEGYKKLLNLTRDLDVTTYEMATEILADEEEHLRSLMDYVADMDFEN